jgi:hypothetical protein
MGEGWRVDCYSKNNSPFQRFAVYIKIISKLNYQAIFHDGMAKIYFSNVCLISFYSH